MNTTLLRGVLPFLFFALPFFMFSQGTITGNVTEALSGQPLPGANVVVKGTTNGTTTDFDGNFELTVSNFPVTLVFSSLGYGSKELLVSAASTVNISLDETATGSG